MPTSALQQFFGFSSFRPPQEEVIAHILAKRDTLAILPTGGGKSLCYQLPALMMEGTAIVISPLIALMKDQVDALRARKLPASFLNSSQTLEEQRAVLAAMRAGELKLVYVSPERFRARGFAHTLGVCPISFIAVDEAHCLSQWGHDFRPDYLRLGQALADMGSPPVAAFTATATPDVREDVRTSLRMRDPAEIVYGFARENLTFNVQQMASKRDKLEHILGLIDELKTGIIYCATRKNVEAVYTDLLTEKVRNLVYYHAGMSEQERTTAQERFMSGKAQVAVATNAFGMGIDRADIRFVAHYEMPGSVEAYYQEGGRAGRDGLTAVCDLLFNFADKRVQEFFVEGANPTPAFIESVYAQLRKEADEQHEIALSIDQLTERFTDKVNPMAVGTALSVLVRQGVIDRFDIPGKRVRGTRLLDPDLKPSKLKIERTSLDEKRARDEKRLDNMVSFCYAKQCRQQWILEYFGEHDTEPCGRCDYCRSNKSRKNKVINGDELEIVRKALSGVARMSWRRAKEEFEARYGKKKIIQCLIGSTAEGITQAGLDNLSTHGILKKEGKLFVGRLFDALEDAGYVRVEEGEYPLLGLTTKGAAVLFGKETCRMVWPAEKASIAETARVTGRAKSAPAPKAPDGELFSVARRGLSDEELLRKLKAKRIAVAAARKVPTFTIFSTKALEELARHRPKTKEDALKLAGFGEKNIKSIGPFLEVIRTEG